MITDFINAVKENIFMGFQFSKLPSEEPASGSSPEAKPATRKSILRRTMLRRSSIAMDKTASEKQLTQLRRPSIGPLGRITKPRYYPIRMTPGSAPESRIPIATMRLLKKDNALAALKKECASATVGVQFPTPNTLRPIRKLALKLSFSSIGSDDRTLRFESMETLMETSSPLANSTLLSTVSSVTRENNNEESAESKSGRMPDKSVRCRRYSPYQVVSIHPFIIRRKSKKNLLGKMEKNNKIAVPLCTE